MSVGLVTLGKIAVTDGAVRTVEVDRNCVWGHIVKSGGMAGLPRLSMYRVREVRLDILPVVCPGNDIYRLSSAFYLHIPCYGDPVSAVVDGQADEATVPEGVRLNPSECVNAAQQDIVFAYQESRPRKSSCWP